MRLYLALRESAHARLFASTPWLTSTIASVLTSAAAGSTPKLGNLTELMGSIDPQNPEEAMQTIAARMEESTDTPEQHARESQLETVLALVIGWVDDVVTCAAAGRLPAEPALQEALRRRRASGGPAEQVFAEIAGLELRPRRVRDAAALWAKLREAGGEAARDRVWSHPDFMPSSADLDDPDAFVASFTGPQLDFSALDELTGPDGDPGARASDDAGENDAGKNRRWRRRRWTDRPCLDVSDVCLLGGMERLHADVVERLRAFEAVTPAEAQARARTLAFLATHPDGVEASCQAGHVTATALVLSDDGRRTLLTLHARIGEWLELGGHLEPDDADLAAASLREGIEESGIPACASSRAS